MRHGKKFNHLGRKKAHRKAMLSNMASSLIEHKRITTTVAKAKALRVYVEPIINRAKDDSTHSRRVVFRYLQDKDSVTELFREVGPKIMDRPGGYTRIIKTGFRKGDGADMCMIELVDFNDLYSNATSKKKKRSRRGGAKKVEGVAESIKDTASDAKEAAADTAADAVAETEAAVDQVKDTTENVADATKEAATDAKDAAKKEGENLADNADGEEKPKDEA